MRKLKLKIFYWLYNNLRKNKEKNQQYLFLNTELDSWIIEEFKKFQLNQFELKTEVIHVNRINGKKMNNQTGRMYKIFTWFKSKYIPQGVTKMELRRCKDNALINSELL